MPTNVIVGLAICFLSIIPLSFAFANHASGYPLGKVGLFGFLMLISGLICIVWIERMFIEWLKKSA